MSDLSSVEGVVNGKPFRVPATISVIHSLFVPRCYKAPTFLIWIITCLLTEASLVYYYMDTTPSGVVTSRRFFTLQFVFWRLMYNVGIGLMLHVQSNYKSFERLVSSQILSRKWLHPIIERCVTFRDPNEKPFKIADYPESFTAWMLFRFVVNVILANDLLSYFVLVWVNWVPVDVGVTDALFSVGPAAILNATPFELAKYALGVGLVAFALWSKSDAHRVIGDFAWYWGDFFFLLNQELHFDGIFDMFPHPMYTVGYAFMYGLTLLSGSHNVFYWSVFGHLCQIVFLTVVENPHIDRTYKATFTPEEEREAQVQEELLYDDERGFFEKRELVVLRNFSFFRGHDLLLLVCMAYGVALWYVTRSWQVMAVHYAALRLVLNGGLGWALVQQSRNKTWTKHFGSSRRAFDSWKVVYNTMVTCTNFAFLLCSVEFGITNVPTLLETWDEWRLTVAIVGALLVGVNIWVSLGVYEVVGDYGYFFGDFFIESCPRRLAYSGVYRYLNNPDTILGCAWYYGVACITYSKEILGLAVATHVIIKLFEVLVEAPHMRRRYGSEIRKEGGVRKAIRSRAKKVTADIRDKRTKLKADYERAMNRLRAEAKRMTREYEANTHGLEKED